MRKKSSNPPRTAAPVRRNTIEVDTSWLIPSVPPPAAAAPQPPPIPATPKRRDTIEVQMEWLEASGSEPPAAPVVPTPVAAKPRGKLPPLLPREEPISEGKTAVAPPAGGSTWRTRPSDRPSRRRRHQG